MTDELKSQEIQALAGTGNGGESKGFTPGRKIKGLLWMSFCVTASAAILHRVGAAETVVTNAEWIIGFGGLVTIGGQALVDTVAKGMAGYAVSKTSKEDGK